MILSIIHRMILLELIRVFLLALVGLTGILLMAGLVVEASQRGLAPGQILAVIPLLIPSTLPYTIPTTTLFAACIVYGRLAHDNEVLAIKAAGISIMQVVWPGVLLGVAISAGTLALYWETIPGSHHLLRTKFLADVEEVLYNMLRRDGRISHPKLPYVIHVNRVQGKKLFEAQFQRRDPTGLKFDLTAWAKEAELHVDLARNLVLVRMTDCYITGEHEKDNGFVKNKVWEVEMPDFREGTAKFRTNDMTWEELFERCRVIDGEMEKLHAEMALHKAAIALQQAPDHFPEHVRHIQYQIRQKQNERRGVETEIHMRPALSLGCLCFVLIGCPVGIWFSRSDYLSAFITSFLPIVFLYYPLLLCAINIARGGRIAPALGVWAANGLMLVIGLFLFARLRRN